MFYLTLICNKCQCKGSCHLLVTGSWHKHYLHHDTRLYATVADKWLNVNGDHVESGVYHLLPYASGVWCVPSATICVWSLVCTICYHMPCIHLSQSQALGIRMFMSWNFKVHCKGNIKYSTTILSWYSPCNSTWVLFLLGIFSLFLFHLFLFMTFICMPRVFLQA